MVIDLKQLEEKRALLGAFFGFQGFPVPAKPMYALSLALAIISPTIVTPLITSFSTALLLGQYFREADHLRPTAKNRVFDFFRSLVPKPQLKPRYETPIILSVA